MHLVQILLPLYDNHGRPFQGGQYRRIQEELAERFGGLTAFTRAPAVGLWEDGEERHHDDIVVYEVMTEAVDRAWWHSFRRDLEQRFRQDSIIIRAQAVELL